MTASYQYDAFGAVKTKTGSGDTAYRFTGELQDAQVARGLYYLREVKGFVSLMRVVAFVTAFLLLLGYGAFGWAHRRFTLRQVSAAGAITGLAVGILLGIAAGAHIGLIVMLTSFFVLGFAGTATLFSYLNRRG